MNTLEKSGGKVVLTKEQAMEFLMLYRGEFPEIPAVKIKASHAREAETIAMNTIPQFKNADYNGMVASAQPPKR
jgi:hypothetical protein